MKFFAVLAVAVACACAAEVPVYRSADFDAPIIRSEYESSPEGSYNYAFETGNNIVAQQDGVVKNYNSDEPTLEVKGSYKYVGQDGVPVETVYVANENGFQAQGSHIPVAPEIPEYILRSLEFIRNHPAPVAEYIVKKQ